MMWLLIFPLLFTTALSVCPNGFVRHGQSCYVRVQQLVSWAEANVFCQLAGSKLVQIESEAENTFVTTWLNTQMQHGSVWIGGHDFLVEGEYHWAESGERITQFWWTEGEPNNWNEEDCIALWKRWQQFVWADGDCNNRSHFVCEKEDYEYVSH